MRLFNGEHSLDIEAVLVDSGADRSLFHASLAEILGLDLRAYPKLDFFGIAGEAVEVALVPITLQVKGLTDKFEIEVGFTEAKGVGALLGQAGFFDRYQITFERAKERLKIKPNR